MTWIEFFFPHWSPANTFSELSAVSVCTGFWTWSSDKDRLQSYFTMEEKQKTSAILCKCLALWSVNDWERIIQFHYVPVFRGYILYTWCINYIASVVCRSLTIPGSKFIDFQETPQHTSFIIQKETHLSWLRWYIHRDLWFRISIHSKKKKSLLDFTGIFCDF